MSSPLWRNPHPSRLRSATTAVRLHAEVAVGDLLGRRRTPAGEPPASPGQILIMMALMSGALFGILGLAIDVGYAVSQRRSMQNAADLAAIAGAHAIAEYQTSKPVAALTSVKAVVDGNKTANKANGGSAYIDECFYVDDSLTKLAAGASCTGIVPELATGVHVVTSETHDTFFIRVLPGAPKQVTTRASATARVELLHRAGEDSPFIVCGYGAKLAGGGEKDILLDDTHVNPDAVGKRFRIVGRNIVAPVDTDGDGLLDVKENRLGTSSDVSAVDAYGKPIGGDTDGDGVPDGLEVANGTNPLVSDVVDLDVDDDGLTDAQEAALSPPTDPANWDTDGDLLSDWAEVTVYSTDPLKKDAKDDALRTHDKDGDGLTDAVEGSPNKNLRDSDGGGTPDGLEVARGTNPDKDHTSDDDWDADGDGLRDDLDPDRTRWDADGGGISDWAESVLNATRPLDVSDDKGTGVDEISNCGMTIVDASGNVSETRLDYKRYNDSDNRRWNGFAHNEGEHNPNNDGRGTTPESKLNPGGNVWYGRKGKSPPDTQRFTVDGVGGCYGSNIVGNPDGHAAANANNFSRDINGNCILAIPIATDAAHGGAPVCPVSQVSPCTLKVVKILSFKIARINGTDYEAQLLDDYPTFGGSYTGWTRDAGGTVVIKLKG